jgi:hypothetical protein
VNRRGFLGFLSSVACFPVELLDQLAKPRRRRVGLKLYWRELKAGETWMGTGVETICADIDIPEQEGEFRYAFTEPGRVFENKGAS